MKAKSAMNTDVDERPTGADLNSKATGADLNSKGEGLNPFRVLKYNVLKAGCYVPGMAVDEAAMYVWLESVRMMNYEL